MKVLHIEERFHPEIGYQLNFFAKFHNPANEFYILTSNSFSLWEGVDNEDIINLKDKEFENKYNIKIIRTTAKFDRKGKYYIWLNNLTKYIEEIKPDLIFVHGVDTISCLRIMLNRKILKRYPIVTDTHTLLNQFSNSLKFKIYLTIIKKIVVKSINKYSIKAFYTTPENKYILEKIYGISPLNIRSCLIGTDTTVYYFDQASRTRMRKQFNINPEDKVLLYVGKLRYSKSPHLILKAVKIIEDKVDKPFCLVFIGHKEKEYFDKYFDVSFENPHIKIMVLPPVKNEILYQYYSMADFSVFPKENTLSSLDSQACRLPLIMEEDETNIERLEKGGIVYKKDDINDLADKIHYFLSNKEYIERLGNEALSFVKLKYDYSQIIKNMEQDLQESFQYFKVKKNK